MKTQQQLRTSENWQDFENALIKQITSITVALKFISERLLYDDK